MEKWRVHDKTKATEIDAFGVERGWFVCICVMNSGQIGDVTLCCMHKCNSQRGKIAATHNEIVEWYHNAWLCWIM